MTGSDASTRGKRRRRWRRRRGGGGGHNEGKAAGEVVGEVDVGTASVAAVEVAPTTAVMEAATAAAEVEAAAASNLFTQTRPKARPHQGTQICTRHRRMTMVSSALLEFILKFGATLS